MAAVNTYPVSLSVDYPDRPLDRLTTLLRIFTVIPIGVILGLLSGGGSGQAAAAGGLLTAPTLLMLVDQVLVAVGDRLVIEDKESKEPAQREFG